MTTVKKNKSVWSSRILKDTSNSFKKFGSSIDIDKRLFKEDIAASIVHVEMLSKQNIISLKIKNKIVWGLKKILNEIVKKKFQFDIKYEDIHMNIENRLFKIIGDDAGYLHTARSRNDQVITDFKLWIRQANNEIINNLNKTIKIILNNSEKHIFTIMPGFTHLKNAQPISLAHYLLAYVEMFIRDRNRFLNNFSNLMENPLGVGAISGTSFNIDRDYTTKKLKFSLPTKNSIDTVSDRDFVVDFLYASSICSMHISRIAEELIIWNSEGFNLITLNDKVVTGSSIMPQKKNPDPLELIRGKTGSIYGNLFSMLTVLKGLPLSYFKDLQDDKKFVFDTFDQLKNSVIVLNEVFKNILFNKKNMKILAEKGYITSTDFADYLVKKLNFPFRKAYESSAKLVNYCEGKNKTLNELKIEEIRKIVPKINEDVLGIFDLKNSINSKKSYGGTSFDNIKKMIGKYKKEIK
tara:strand:- start:1843 stop:3237 length:1395 start_codon:yes stop_codon:yes gene_type:complete